MLVVHAVLLATFSTKDIYSLRSAILFLAFALAAMGALIF
jgi:hypothetical protein